MSRLEMPEMDPSRTFYTGIAVFVIALLAAGLYSATDDPTQQSDFNRADVMFMNMMIIHHDQAIEMAELAYNRTDNENILELADNISAAQTRENEQMAEWLGEIGFDRPTRGHRMAGMATQQEMNQLRQSNGTEFDLLFSKLMIEHHQGGVQMARAEVQNGRSEKLVELAQGMIDAQQKEIRLMQRWRTEWT